MMKKKMAVYQRVIIAITLLYGVTMSAFAQISEGGFPPSFQYETTLRSKAAVTKIPITFNVEDLKQVDAWQESEGLTPPCVATLIEVNMNPTNAGSWSTLPDGQKIWQLELQVENAIALMLYYSDFYIPEGGKLFIYNTEKTQVLGAYTHATHPTGGRFATEFVSGDALTLEYVPAPSGEEPRIEIESVGYGYNHLSATPSGVSFRSYGSGVGSCEVNVNCSEGDAWQNQKKGVCHTVQKIGSSSYVCTASLVNNTAQDLTPYILTALHCQSDGSINASPADLEQWMFYFHMERINCSSNSIAMQSATMTGCKRIAFTETDKQSDGLLLRLTQSIPESYNVYYNGWDRSGKTPQSGVCIHHPGNDYKKISTYTTPASNYTFEDSDSNMKGDAHAHWNVTFAETANGFGVTENGSSGSPLFNESKLIVGTLTGGSSSCSDLTGLNLFGKMSYHWNKYASGDSSHFDQYLDPKGSGVETLEGRFYQLAASPSNLNVTNQDGTINLKWNAPSGSSPLKYYVFCNNTQIGETTSLSYSDESPKIGVLIYSVTAVYSNGNQSSAISSSTTVLDYKMPINVTATHTTAQKAAVMWDAPVYEQTIYWGDTNSQYQVDMNPRGSYNPFYFGQLWTKDDIRLLNLKTITAVKFIPVRGNTYEIYIAQGNRTYSQKITPSKYSQTNTVTLTTPFVIDGTQQLIVAIYISQLSNSGDYPAICDGGPAIDGKGDIYSFDGKAWSSMHSGSDAANFDFNFFVAAVVSSKEGELPTTYANETSEVRVASNTATLRKMKISEEIPTESVSLRSIQPSAFPAITGYNIYRDNVKIATVGTSPLRYVDSEELKKTVTYQVSALYGENESKRSDGANISPTGILDNAGDIRIYPTLFSNSLQLFGAERVTKIEFYGTDGKCYLQAENPNELIDTQSLPSGIYFVRIHTAQETQTIRAVKK